MSDKRDANFVSHPEGSAQEKYYTYMLRQAKAENLDSDVKKKALMSQSLTDQVETDILVKLYGMSDLSPDLSWTLQMCEAKTREEAASRLAKKVLAQRITDNLTKQLITESELSTAVGASTKVKINAFGV